MPDIPLPKPQPPTVPKSTTPPPQPGGAIPAPMGLPKPPTLNLPPVPVSSGKPAAAIPSMTTPIPTPAAGPIPSASSPARSVPGAMPSVGPSVGSSPALATPATIPGRPAVGATLPTPPRPGQPAPSIPGSVAATPLGSPPGMVKPENPLAPPPGAKTQAATTGNPLLRFLPFIIGGVVLLLLALGAYALFGRTQKPTPVSSASPTPAANRQVVSGRETQLVYWGLWEPSATMTSIFADFEAAHPGIKVVYQVQSHVDYRQRLQTAVASGNGPDLFRFHASWVPMLSSDLASMPSKIMSVAEFQQTFYPVASQQLQYGGQIVGIPLMYDGLGLYYNQEVLSTAGAEPPKTWVELKNLASRLTIKSGDNISRSGLAIGNASTTEHFADILALLMLQNGADPKNVTSKEVQDALVFYTNFITKDQVWDEKLPTSTVAFARGDAAMMLAPSWRAHEVLAINPNLKFGITTVPTLGTERVTWASYWAEGVSNKSKNQDAAWELIKYLSSAPVMQKMYSEQAKTRAFGEIYSRVDLADSLASDPYVAPFLADAPYAKGWYLSSYTHDNGLNDNLIKYYQDAVNALISGKQIGEVIETLSLGSQQILRQYNIK